VARKRNPARLVVALSVAAVLAVVILYTSISGGGTPSIQPSELSGQTGVVSLVGRVVPGYRGDSYGNGLRFRLRDIDGASRATVEVLYTGSVSDQFRADREISV
jgi:cytochrome c-type biogenesis protein CcmE